VFDKDNKFINGKTINPRDLVFIKCFVDIGNTLFPNDME
jgi:hypothetical protein